MKKNIIILLIISIFWCPLTILASNCPNGQHSDCETGECKTIEELKNKYCKQIGDPDKFYNEKYEPAAQAANKLADLIKDNPVERFQNEPLPAEYAINVENNKYEKKQKDKIYLDLGGNDLFSKTFKNKTVNCYLLHDITDSLETDKIISNAPEMYNIIWENSCKADAHKLQEATIALQLLINLLELPVTSNIIDLGPKKEFHLLSIENIENLKAEDIKKLIEALYCKYNTCTKPEDKVQQKSPVPIYIVAGALTALAIGIGIYGFQKNKIKENLDLEGPIADAKITAEGARLSEISDFVTLFSRDLKVTQQIAIDLSKFVDLAELSKLASIEDIARIVNMKAAMEAGKFEDLIRLAKTDELAAAIRLEELGLVTSGGRDALRVARQLKMVAK